MQWGIITHKNTFWWLSCCSSWVNTTASSFLSLLTLIHPPLHRYKSSCWAPSFIFSPSSRPVSLFLFLIHLFPSDQKPVKHPVAFLCSRVSHESGRPSSHPRGHGGTLRSASLRIKHIKSSNGRFPSPPPPSFHWGVTFFSFYTSLHTARLYSCPSEEEEEEGGAGGGFSYIPSPVSILHCPSVYLSHPSFFTLS